MYYIKRLSQAFVFAGALNASQAAEAQEGQDLDAANLNCNHLIQTGEASWYKSGKKNANGKAFRPKSPSIAHKTLPFGTILKVQSVDPDVKGSVTAEVKDRGPFIKGRVVDLSLGAANKIDGFIEEGVVRVNVFKCTPR